MHQPRRRSVLLGGLAATTLAGCRGADATPAPSTPSAPVTSWAPAPKVAGGSRMLASQSGTTLRLHTKDGDRTFWAGVNLGSTTPGHSPGELAISREEYRRWFDQMGQLGVRVLRVYTIHQPQMYEELKRYNESHADAPLYLVHGIYLPDESYLDTHNLFDPIPTAAMDAEIDDVVKAMMGTLRRAPQRGRASGTWTADVSKWTAAWLVGVEWDPVACVASDQRNAKAPGHTGTYFSSTKAATPTERWIAARMDRLAHRLAEHRLCVPIALVNWPTADPLRHPEEGLPREDALSVDANHVVAGKSWPAGTFASYHAYPYYPDFQLLQPSYAGPDRYQAYLRDLQQHHASMPMMVTEFGVPATLGCAHRGSNGRHQGDHSEQESMRMDAEMLRMFKETGLAGGLVFSWVDEWFKFTWNTLPRQEPVDPERRALWHDPLTNEQFFGMLAQDPNRAGRRVPHEGATGIREIGIDHDASHLHVDLTADLGQGVTLAFDVLPGLGLPVGGDGTFAVKVTISGDHADCFVAGTLDPLHLDGLPAASVPAPDADGWSIQRMTLNRPYTVPVTGQALAADLMEVGRLIRGSWDPSDSGFDGRATWQISDNRLRLRLPWSMLLLADPSSKTALDARTAIPKGVAIEQIRMRVQAAGQRVDVPIGWEGWNRTQHTERLKTGVGVLGDAMRATSV